MAALESALIESAFIGELPLADVALQTPNFSFLVTESFVESDFHPWKRREDGDV